MAGHAFSRHPDVDGDIMPDLSWEEVDFLAQGLALAARPLKSMTLPITEEFGLGPRGAWILLLIANGQTYPLALARTFGVGSSLITSELGRLAEAELITSRPAEGDRRRSELTMTKRGEGVCRRVKAVLGTSIRVLLDRYSRDDLLLCARMLRDFQYVEAGRIVADDS